MSDLLDRLTHRQIEPWMGMQYSYESLFERLAQESLRQLSTFVYVIHGSSVQLLFNSHIQQIIDEGAKLETVRRAVVFQGLLQETMLTFPSSKKIVLAIDTADLAKSSDVPVFSFQRERTDRILLLPDMELIHYDYHEDYADNIAYVDKAPIAYFEGSTTGVQSYTMEDLRLDKVERIRAGRFFKNTNRVEFRLPNICQYASDDVRDALLAEGFGTATPNSTFKDEDCKFRITMDGNGATCSRTSTILKSNSVMLMYNSPHELFYTGALIPWEHYIPISHDSDVLTVVQQETESPGKYAHIAASASSHALDLTSRSACVRYTAKVLEAYARVVVS